AAPSSTPSSAREPLPCWPPARAVAGSAWSATGAWPGWRSGGWGCAPSGRAGADPLDQFLIGRFGQGLVELGAVVGGDADAVDHPVVDEPSVTPGAQAIVDGHVSLTHEHARADGGLLALHRLPRVGDLLAA